MIPENIKKLVDQYRAASGTDIDFFRQALLDAIEAALSNPAVPEDIGRLIGELLTAHRHTSTAFTEEPWRADEALKLELVARQALLDAIEAALSNPAVPEDIGKLIASLEYRASEGFGIDEARQTLETAITAQHARIADLEARLQKAENSLKLHAGDVLSLDNEVETMRSHWQEAEARADALAKQVDRVTLAAKILYAHAYNGLAWEAGREIPDEDLPGWLADCKSDIIAALADSPAPTEGER